MNDKIESIGGKLNAENFDKYKNLVHYICQTAEIGATQLNKILFFIDFSYYKQHNRSLTFERYKKDLYGPVPKKIADILRDLKDDSKMVVKESIEPYKNTRFIVLSEISVNELGYDGETIDLIQKWIGIIKECSATKISKITHSLGWELAEMNKNIPYFTIFVFFGTDEVNKNDIEIGKSNYAKYKSRNS